LFALHSLFWGVILDLQGVKSIKHTDLNAIYLFIQPPSLEALESRLRGRGTETEESLSKRLLIAKEEMDYAKLPGAHDKIIVNDDLDKAFEELDDFVKQYWGL